MAVLAPTANAAPPWLSDRDLAFVFAGRELKGFYANGAIFSEIYHRDGTLDYTDNQHTLSGKWKIDNQQFCTEYDGGPGGCFNIKKLSDNCFEYWLAGNSASESSWLARASQSKYPATCPN